MDPSSRRARRALGLAALAAAAAGLWLLSRGGAPTAPETSAAPPAPQARLPEVPEPAGATGTGGGEHRIAESGRLRLEADALPAEGELTLALDLPDAARGSGPRPVVIVSVDGRRLEATAEVLPGAGTGVRLALDPRWLEPGLYMIEVTTAEPSHFPVRRYVLEIREPALSEADAERALARRRDTETALGR